MQRWNANGTASGSYAGRASLFFLLLLFNAFMLTKLPIRDVAIVTVSLTHFLMLFILGYLFARKMVFLRSFKLFYLGMLLFTVFNALLFISNPIDQDGTMLIHILLVLSFALGAAHIAWNDAQLNRFACISAGLTLIFLIHWLFAGTPLTGFQGLIRNPNITGVLLSILLFFPLVRFNRVRPAWRIFLGISIASALILIYVSSARAAMLLILVMLAARIVLSLFKPLFSKLFYAVMGFNAIFLLVFGMTSHVSLFEKLNAWSIDAFGKRLLSGRQDIWEQGIQYGLEKPFFGHGLGIDPNDFMDGTQYVHAHNQYLQIFLENGLVGLAFFILLLFGIWKVLLKRLNLTVVRWTACFFLGLLVYQSVEISFFSNMPSIGLLQWFIIGVGLSAVLYHSPEWGQSANPDEANQNNTQTRTRSRQHRSR
ncbi:hypothetical protein GCM10028778_12280 [Barrientosiimonas marina]|uniref:O-antigen ligase family protein n=1 Tax=Lentibacillus kimchii TaxID=1542911 RepID=A0ABW2UWX3_9BACI